VTPPVLGIDTSTAVSTACVLRQDGEAFEVSPAPAALRAPPEHARELLPAVAEVMRRADVEIAELAAIAVGVGPGSFTGLRIGVTTARALASAAGLSLRPVSSLAALAAGIVEGCRRERPVALPLIDARRGELFGALYEGGRRVCAPFAARPEEVARLVRRELARDDREAAVTPLAAGDGSLRFRGVLEPAGIRVAPEGSRIHLVRALHICRLGLAAPEASPQAVVPEYLRAPDAKPL
jgi:tRNA threonylcarbamoyladenosine biosynthesis protein TsaB